MRLLRFRHGDRIATGVADTGDDTVRVLAGTFFEDPLPTGEELRSTTLHLLAPVLPSKLVCVGKNYAAHAAEFGMTVPEEPLLFLKPSTAVIGPNDPITLLPVSTAGRLRRRARGRDRAAREERPGRGRLPGDPRVHVCERRDPARPAEDRRPVGTREGLRRLGAARARGSRPTSTRTTRWSRHG